MCFRELQTRLWRTAQPLCNVLVPPLSLTSTLNFFSSPNFLSFVRAFPPCTTSTLPPANKRSTFRLSEVCFYYCILYVQFCVFWDSPVSHVAPDAAASLIQHRNRLFAFDRSNALLEFLLEGAPQVTLSVHDSKKVLTFLHCYSDQLTCFVSLFIGD